MALTGFLSNVQCVLRPLLDLGDLSSVPHHSTRVQYSANLHHPTKARHPRDSNGKHGRKSYASVAVQPLPMHV
jgi:hypothetical protein